jgi:hypothetical protein
MVGVGLAVIAIVIVVLTGLVGSGKTTADLNESQSTQNPLFQQHADEKKEYFIPSQKTQYFTYTGGDSTLAILQQNATDATVCTRTTCEGATSVTSGTILKVTTTGSAGFIKKDNLDPAPAAPTLVNQEPLIVGRTMYAPLLTKDGDQITTQQQLEDAYKNEDITLYRGGTEISIAVKPASKKGSFQSQSAYNCSSWAPGDCIDVLPGVCFGGGTGLPMQNPLTDILKIENSPTIPEMQGLKYHISTNHPYNFATCNSVCWNPQNPCSPLIGFEITTGGDDSIVNGWTWGVYNYDLTYGESLTDGVVGINPSDGTITGLAGDFSISYYHR